MVEARPILQVCNITKDFPGTRALSDLSVLFYPGEVHAIVGENGAGKSTLMNVISGVMQPDHGKIVFEGKEMHFASPVQSQNVGIGFVHQELALCQHISVAENVFMGRLPRNVLGLIDHKTLYRDTKRILDLFKSATDPATITSGLCIADQQVVEIAKSLSLNCKVIMFDEPTSSLTDDETDSLFAIISTLKRQGISVIYISHRMPEIFKISDRISVLRDGCLIDTKMTAETSSREIISKMVGREVGALYPPKSASIGGEICRFSGFSRGKKFKDIGFSLKRGEILGIAGLVGAGRTEIARAVCAIDGCDSGEVSIGGEKVALGNYRDAIRHGICYLTENRKADGLFLDMDLVGNTVVTKLDELSKLTIIDARLAGELTAQYLKKLNVKHSTIFQKMSGLSGGNQQKTMFGKWLIQAPKILFLDEPTRGIDVGAKSEIHTLLRELSTQGIGIVIISSELQEIIGMCDRVVVIHEGVVSGVVEGGEITETRIISLASGHGDGSARSGGQST
jgi:ribose transport system ATP-binding protein